MTSLKRRVSAPVARPTTRAARAAGKRSAADAVTLAGAGAAAGGVAPPPGSPPRSPARDGDALRAELLALKSGRLCVACAASQMGAVLSPCRHEPVFLGGGGFFFNEFFMTLSALQARVRVRRLRRPAVRRRSGDLPAVHGHRGWVGAGVLVTYILATDHAAHVTPCLVPLYCHALLSSVATLRGTELCWPARDTVVRFSERLRQDPSRSPRCGRVRHLSADRRPPNAVRANEDDLRRICEVG